MHQIDLSADALVSALLELSRSETVCLLDSCGVGHLGSHLLIAGIEPREVHSIANDDPIEVLALLDEKLSNENAAVFTISYDFGIKLEKIASKQSKTSEPDVFLALFDCLIVHDYDTNTTHLTGNENRFKVAENKILKAARTYADVTQHATTAKVESNFAKPQYLAAIETIKEHIRSGNTYQTNLTQQLTARLPAETTPQSIFWNLRKAHPAPFAAFITRENSTVISASPERFFRIEESTITTSPIKGTRPRGKNAAEDQALKQQLLTSQKDIAENTMIVDLLRNDIGRVCEFGSVRVERLCDLEEHPTLFHLVSTISGELKQDVPFSEILKAVFPSGSITGAPKISTVRIIDEIEPDPRGLSMGAIGISIPNSKFQIPNSKPSLNSQLSTLNHIFDLSVAIRTMTIRNGTANFNVGGGIVIDSGPEDEYEESLLKAKALLDALGAKLNP
jgi:para-aminobenzoate synthetase component 1